MGDSYPYKRFSPPCISAHVVRLCELHPLPLGTKRVLRTAHIISNAARVIENVRALSGASSPFRGRAGTEYPVVVWEPVPDAYNHDSADEMLNVLGGGGGVVVDVVSPNDSGLFPNFVVAFRDPFPIPVDEDARAKRMVELLVKDVVGLIR